MKIELKKYQIVSSFGQGSYRYDYFIEPQSCSEEELKKIAIEIVRNNYTERKNSGMHFFYTPKELPTITVNYYNAHTNESEGVAFKTKWR